MPQLTTLYNGLNSGEYYINSSLHLFLTFKTLFSGAKRLHHSNNVIILTVIIFVESLRCW